MSIRFGTGPYRLLLAGFLAALAAGALPPSDAEARWFEGRGGGASDDARAPETDRSGRPARDDGWRPERPDRGSAESGWRPERPGADAGTGEGRLTPDKIERWKRLPPEQRDRLKERYRRWKELPPEQREREAERLRRWRALPEEDRDTIRSMYRGWRELPPERREELRGKIGEWRSLPPDEREDRMNSWRFYRDQSPEGKKAIRRYLFDRSPERPGDGSRRGRDPEEPGGRRR